MTLQIFDFHNGRNSVNIVCIYSVGFMIEIFLYFGDY